MATSDSTPSQIKIGNFTNNPFIILESTLRSLSTSSISATSKMIVDGNEYAVLSNSCRVSGFYFTEVRMFVLDPSMLLVDSNQAHVVHAPAISSSTSPAQQSIDPSSVMGGRVNSSNNEGYIYISQNLVPPE